MTAKGRHTASADTFWGHLEVFRWVIIRSLLVLTGLAVVIFCYKDFVFDRIVLAPCDGDFITYRLMCRLANWVSLPSLCPQMQSIEMININLASQLFVHISISFCMALLVAFPYLMVDLWFFVAPALYRREKRMAVKTVIAFFFQFFLGVFLAYYLIFPLTLNFLGNYQVSERVVNQISLNSYVSTLSGLLFMLGLAFEMPIVACFFAKIGVLTAEMFTRFRKYSVVVVLVLAAIITPSTDIFTMLLVALPLQLLYEFSRIVVKKGSAKRSEQFPTLGDF